MERSGRAFVLLLAALGASVSASSCTVGQNQPGHDAAVSTGPDAAYVSGMCTSTADADADGLYDMYESTQDWDGDGTPNDHDTDSDNDGLPDADESGAVGGCAGRDTDHDGIPDYLDTDSDADGLSDQEEASSYHTDPYNADTDGDGFTDLGEIASSSANPLDPTIGIPADDFYVVLPYMRDMVDRPLSFGTNIQQADVFIMVDRTGSMSEEISSLKSSLASTVTQMAMQIPDIGVGFGGFAGFGGSAAGHVTCVLGICSGPDGPDGDVPFHLYSTITTNPAEMVADVMPLAADQGGATWASFNEALYQAATGEGIAPWVPPQNCLPEPDAPGVRYGYPCFRPGSLPIMVVVSDSSSKNGPLVGASGTYDASGFTMGPPPHTYEQTRDSLVAIGARVIGIASTAGSSSGCGPQVSSPTGVEQYDVYANDTGTIDASGAPIVFTIGCDGTGLGTRLVDAVREIATETPQDITTAVRDGADFPMGATEIDARNFVKAITPTSLDEPSGATTCPDATRCDALSFYDVRPGGRVYFDVHFYNDFVPPASSAQIFRATIVVLGNGVAQLDSHEVIIVVPAGSMPIVI